MSLRGNLEKKYSKTVQMRYELVCNILFQFVFNDLLKK